MPALALKAIEENEPTELSHKQLRFVFEYLIDHNAAAAARRAGYSDSTRGSQAAALMKNPLIRARIDAEMEGIFDRLRVNAERLLQAQARAAFCDPRKMFGPDGKLKPMNELDEETAGAITVSCEEGPRGRVLRVRQSPRHTALATVAKRYAHFIDTQTMLRGMSAGSDEPEEAARETAQEQTAPTEPFPALQIAPAEAPTLQPVVRSAAVTPLPQHPRHGARKQGKNAGWRNSGLLNSLYTAKPSAQAEAKKEASAAHG